jgi:hypothetical protein
MRTMLPHPVSLLCPIQRGTASPASSAAAAAAAAHLLLLDLVRCDGLVQLLAAGCQLIQPPVHVCWLKVRQARLVEHLYTVLQDAQPLQQLVAIHVELLQLAHLGPGQWNVVYGRLHARTMLLRHGMRRVISAALAVWVLRAGHGGWSSGGCRQQDLTRSCSCMHRSVCVRSLSYMVSRTTCVSTSLVE